MTYQNQEEFMRKKRIRERRNKIKRELKAEIDSMTDDQLSEALPDILRDLVDKFHCTCTHLLKGHLFVRIVKAIERATSFLDKYIRREGFDPDLRTRIYYAMNKKTDIEHCANPNCKHAPDNPYLHCIHMSSDPNTLRFCNTYCAQQSPQIVEKIKSTKERNHTTTKDLVPRQKARFKAKHGVESNFQLPSVKAKIKSTWKSHGYDHPMHSEKVKSKLRQTLKDQCGEDITSSFQLPSAIKKIKKINRQRYGTDYPLQNKAIRKIAHEHSTQTKRRMYYRSTILNFKTASPLFSEDEYATKRGVMRKWKWKCSKCNREFEQRMFKYEQPRCLECDPLIYESSTSNFEREVRDFIETCARMKYKVIYEREANYSVIPNRQLDVICCDKKTGEVVIAFEMNGVYWHSDKFKDRDYHMSKMIECEKRGIALVNIWEDEWSDDKQKMMFLIKLILSGKRVQKDGHKHLVVKSMLDESIETTFKLSRDKFNRCVQIEGYECIGETKPMKVQRFVKDGEVMFNTWNCGCLSFQKSK